MGTKTKKGSQKYERKQKKFSENKKCVLHKDNKLIDIWCTSIFPSYGLLQKLQFLPKFTMTKKVTSVRLR